MRTKIDFGIDLGTTNSAIAKMDNGKPTIIQTDTQKDTLPSCIAVNPRKNLIYGDAAYAANIKDKLRLLKTFGEDDSNCYLEFKRNMGKDIKRYSSILGKDFSPEELSSEVLKRLKSFVPDEQLKSIVITVPAKFTIAQNEATRKAAKLAGFEVVELLQEPIAASIAYGLDAKNKEGIWLVFDFGGGTFDAALVRVEEGIMKVLDTEGDNELGGKDLDLAIVDKIIIPYLQDNYSIGSFLSDKKKRQILRDAMKSFAERAKIDLSFNSTTDITTMPSEIGAMDNENNELELCLDVTQNDLIPVFEPIFQKAIDITKQLLQRKSLKGSDLDCLILVGGPTYSPILQKMLKEQITTNVIAKNQMTAVAIGAALYASTKDVGVVLPPLQKGTVALEIKYNATTVQMEEFINIKINSKESNLELPEKLYVTLQRADKSFSSDRVQINDLRATLINVQLNLNNVNHFSIIVTDENHDVISCEPNSINILQGLKAPLAPLPYNIGIEVWNEKRNLKIFKGLKGLEKNQILRNAVGQSEGLKTPKQIRPGNSSDKLIIPIYQGEDGAENTNSFYSNHVTDVIITGEKFPRVLPANSDMEITFTFNENGAMPVCSVFFPAINYTEEISLEYNKDPKVDAAWLKNEIKYDIARVNNVLKADTNIELQKSLKSLKGLEENFIQEEGSEEGKMRILKNLRNIRLIIDKFENDKAWPAIRQELTETYYQVKNLVEVLRSEGAPDNLSMPKVEAQLSDFERKVEEIVRLKDVDLAMENVNEIRDFERAIADALMPKGEREKQYIDYMNRNFNSITWINATKAREFINKAISIISDGDNVKQLSGLCSQISDLVDRTVDRPPIPIPIFAGIIQ